MSKNPVPVQQLFQALSSGRLFWIDSALNQSQVGTRCPYLCGALYLYLFNLRLVDSIKPYIDEPMIARLDAVLYGFLIAYFKFYRDEKLMRLKNILII